MDKKPLLRLLADGSIHSGESLAESLGVSRTAIWKQIRKLQDGGISVETIRGRGYRLASPMDLLLSDEINGELDGSLNRRLSLRVHDRIDSTNSDVTRRWQQGESGILVSIADCQEQGRGRRGRPWQSPVGQNLYMSVGITIARGFTELDGLSLVAGLALVRALERAGMPGLGLKWPNDVHVSGRKLAGILIELQGELEGAVRVIVGIGLNVHMNEAEAVDQPWTSLALAAPHDDWRRNPLAAAVLNDLLRELEVFERAGFPSFADRWNQYDVFSGQHVAATSGEISGVGLGVDASGNYLLETGQGVEKVRAGEISLRVTR